MRPFLFSWILFVSVIALSECSPSLFGHCPEPWTIQSTSRFKRVWWSAPSVRPYLVSAVRRYGLPSGSLFEAGEHLIIYFAAGFDGSNSTCEVTFTVEVTACLPLPRIGRLNVRCTNGNIISSRCDFDCPYGYELVGGEASTTCSVNATWSPATFPVCRIMACLPLPRIGRLNVRCTNGNIISSRCDFDCPYGYELVGGEASTTCSVNASWSPATFPICRIVICPSLHPPRNSIMRCSSTYLRQGTYCLFTCVAGYQRSGSDLRKCVARNWTGTPTICEDRQPPTIHRCPLNFRVNTDYGASSSRVDYPSPFVMDKTGEVLRLTTGQVPGSRFHIGSNLVEYTAEDAAGNTAKCRFYVHVTDNQPPRFQYCPAPIFRYPSTDSPVAVVHYTTPMATDNSSPNPINVTRILGLASGSTFPPGVHLIQYSASDATGNYAKCIFHIVVRATSCKALEEHDSLKRTCSRMPPYQTGSWCDFSCMGGKVLVGSPTRTCTQDGWSGIPAICINDVSGAFLNVMEGALPEPVGTDMPDEYQTITILADFVYVT
ncbi:putative sushi, von Willebrand factor type A [Apostichopus japonicus]|uniref:Putative sushi, von Willebrand factor type A n=1 Tax=Stichopus japonicus TaxID=307972 RepID=A0A2G8K2N7_STIJA|nr:putative sushi, von Willebrand factor type A [Apostichopus japonicus]